MLQTSSMANSPNLLLKARGKRVRLPGHFADPVVIEDLDDFGQVLTLRVRTARGEPKDARAALQKFGANYGTSPETTVGAGPFVLKQWTRDAQVSMDRNPNYWNLPRPYVDTLVIKFFSDPTAGWNTFQTGGGDGFVNSLLGSNALARPCDAGFPTRDLKEPSPGLAFQAFNTKLYPFNDARARRAFGQV